MKSSLYLLFIVALACSCSQPDDCAGISTDASKAWFNSLKQLDTVVMQSETGTLDTFTTLSNDIRETFAEDCNDQLASGSVIQTNNDLTRISAVVIGASVIGSTEGESVGFGIAPDTNSAPDLFFSFRVNGSTRPITYDNTTIVVEKFSSLAINHETYPDVVMGASYNTQTSDTTWKAFINRTDGLLRYKLENGPVWVRMFR